MNQIPTLPPCRLSSLLAGRGERANEPVDPVDDDRVRGSAGADRGDGLHLHMHLLVKMHGQPGWVAALTPLSVDGMIVAASTTLLADSRTGRGSVAGCCRGRC